MDAQAAKGFLNEIIGKPNFLGQHKAMLQFTYKAPDIPGLDHDGRCDAVIKKMNGIFGVGADFKVNKNAYYTEHEEPFFYVTLLGRQEVQRFVQIAELAGTTELIDEPPALLAERRPRSIKLLNFQRMGATVTAEFAAPMVHDGGREEARLQRQISAVIFQATGRELQTETSDFSIERVTNVDPKTKRNDVTFKVTITDPKTREAFVAWASEHKLPGRELVIKEPQERAI